MRPKKIIFTVTNDLTYDQRMLRICTTLAQEGYSVQLVGRQLDTSKPFQNPYFTTYRFSLFFNKGKLFYIEYNVRLFFWLLFQPVDVVCGIDLDIILPCYFVAILRGKKCVYDAHELYSETPEVIRRPLIRKVWLAVERFIVPRVKYRYTVSQSVADEFKKRYGTHFELIRNLPFRKESSVVLSKTSFIILYQGNLNEGRGLEIAVEAMKSIENAELWIVGDGDLMLLLRGMVSDMKLEKKVKFWGYIEPKNLPNITQQASVGLNIAEGKSLSYQLSLSNKTTDYIQSGLPQIFINFIEFQRINEEYQVGLVIDKLETQTLVTAIKKLKDDPILWQNLHLNCLEAAKTLNWEHEKQKLIAFYAQCLNSY
ncbi:MAG: glycosyltransferase [Saprospiraceae bacterium]|nr:glycosyltransferase [Saprospiraceae bacterium]